MRNSSNNGTPSSNGSHLPDDRGDANAGNDGAEHARSGAMLDRAGAIFLAVRELEPRAREDAVEHLCAGNIELKKLVLLLVRGDQAPLPVESLAEDIRAAYDSRLSFAPEVEGYGNADRFGGDRIGNYRILERLGEGGFGIVFMAEQERPVRRRVALKIIKLGMDTRQVVARFEAERQALALMDHPNIAKVFDAGATDTGRPYFVMELVRGLPITEYCDRKKLPIRERLELIAQVCDALQHAHQKGVIHRDIKPSNVLVEGIEGTRDQGIRKRKAASPDASLPLPHESLAAEPLRVKVIDFGIAKATSARLTEKTIFTELRQMIGTPEYMSPEQAGESNEDVDTRTDVYSAGVLLYELLTGSTPFDSRRLRSAAFGEMQRIIREEEPVKPSTKLTTCPDGLHAIASQRATHPAKLSGTIRGELDWIVMKSLEKDRSRRYESAGAMAADIQRYLSGHAVHAAPPGQVYRARKFIRRHKGSAMAGSLLVIALIAGLVGTSLGFVNANEQRDRADGERRRAVAAESATRRQADDLRKISDFQASTLAQINPETAGNLLRADVEAKFQASLAKAGVPEASDDRASRLESFRSAWSTINTTDVARRLIDHTILKPADAAIDEQFKNQPLLGAIVRENIADRYRSLGLYDDAVRLEERVVATRRAALGEDDPDTIASSYHLGMVLVAAARLDEAEALLRDSLKRHTRVMGAEHRRTLVSMNSLGQLLRTRGKLDEAEQVLRASVEQCRRVLGSDDADTLISIYSLGALLSMARDTTEAEALLRESTAGMRREMGDENPEALTSMCTLALVLKRGNKLDEAEALLDECLRKRRKVLGEEHPDTLMSLSNMGPLLLAKGKLNEAELLLRELLDKRRLLRGDDDADTLIVLNNLGAALKAQGKLDEAEPYYREAAATQRRVLTDEHPNTLTSINNLGQLLSDQGKLDEAEPYLREALEKRRRILGEEHDHTLFSVAALGQLLGLQGKHAEALELLVPMEARAREAFIGQNARRLPAFMLSLGRSRAALAKTSGEYAKAETALLEAHVMLVSLRGEEHKDTQACARSLVDLYIGWNVAEPDNGHDAKAAEWKAKAEKAPAGDAAVPPSEAK